MPGPSHRVWVTGSFCSFLVSTAGVAQGLCLRCGLPVSQIRIQKEVGGLTIPLHRLFRGAPVKRASLSMWAPHSMPVSSQ